MGWVGCDFDGVLATQLGDGHEPGWIGEPIWPMIEIILDLIYSEGKTIKIFTARVASTNPDRETEREAILDWTMKNIGFRFEITSEKDRELEKFFDDKAISVEKNTGRILSPI